LAAESLRRKGNRQPAIGITPCRLRLPACPPRLAPGGVFRRAAPLRCHFLPASVPHLSGPFVFNFLKGRGAAFHLRAARAKRRQRQVPREGATCEKWEGASAVQDARGEFHQRVGSSFNLKIGRVRTRRSAPKAVPLGHAITSAVRQNRSLRCKRHTARLASAEGECWGDAVPGPRHRLLSLGSAIMVFGTFSGAAAAANASLFDAFQKYCVSTNAQVDAVAAAVGRDHGVPERITVDVKPGTRMLAWDIPGLDYWLAVNVVDGAAGPSLPPGTHSAVCVAVEKKDATGSLTALREWIGLSPNKQTTGKGSIIYEYAFTLHGSEHIAQSSDPALFAEAVKNGGAWRLMAGGSEAGGSIALAHYYMPSSPND